MKPVLFALATIALIAPALPAAAGGIIFTLPSLTFPAPTTPDTTKSCTRPATLNDTCPTSRI